MNDENNRNAAFNILWAEPTSEKVTPAWDGPNPFEGPVSRPASAPTPGGNVNPGEAAAFASTGNSAPVSGAQQGTPVVAQGSTPAALFAGTAGPRDADVDNARHPQTNEAAMNDAGVNHSEPQDFADQGFEGHDDSGHQEQGGLHEDQLEHEHLQGGNRNYVQGSQVRDNKVQGTEGSYDGYSNGRGDAVQSNADQLNAGQPERGQFDDGRSATAQPAEPERAPREVVGNNEDLPEDSLTIGRSRSNGIVLDDMLVSRRHAIITADDEGLLMRDLGSRNGTFVNGRRVEQTHLHEGDRIGIGASTFEVRDGWLMSI